MNNYCVYIHYTKDTKIPFYVGKGIKNRPYVKSNRRSEFWNSVNNKHGHMVNIFRNNLSELEAFTIEKCLIKYFGRRDLGNGTLVNLTNGGDGHSGYVKSEELKRKISSWTKGRKLSKEHKEALRNANLGKRLKQETREKISMIQKGKKKKPFSEQHINNMKLAMQKRCQNPEYIEKLRSRFINSVIQMDKEGNQVKIWDSHLEAAKHLNGRSDRILKACKENCLHKNFKWKFYVGE